MAQFIIYFNQQWVGDHSAEWFASRGPLARAVIEEMKTAGVYVAAGGVDEKVESVNYFVPTEDSVSMMQRSLSNSGEYLGGFTVIDVESQEQAQEWAAKVAAACGWPQALRRLF